jgi:segregation and condensation protein B
MAKKPARKQAPPKPGESAVREPSGDEPSVESLVAALGGADSETQSHEAASDEAASEAAASDEAGSDAAASEAASSEEAASEATPPGEVTDGEAEPADGIKLVDSLPIDPDDDLSEVEGEASPRLVSIVESLLFASTKPLRVKQLRKNLQEPSVRQIQLALKHLIGQNEERGIILAQVAGGFVLQTSPKNATWVQTLLQAKPVRLSRPQLETLAVVAYRQPVTRPEIDHIRGVDSAAVIKLLLERELIQIVGKKDEVGRPMLFGTTVGFLEFFNLMSLRDLPDLREFRELSEETKATLRKNMADDEVEALGQEVLQFARPAAGGESASEQEAESEAGDVDASEQGEAQDGDDGEQDEDRETRAEQPAPQETAESEAGDDAGEADDEPAEREQDSEAGDEPDEPDEREQDGEAGDEREQVSEAGDEREQDSDDAGDDA